MLEKSLFNYQFTTLLNSTKLAYHLHLVLLELSWAPLFLLFYWTWHQFSNYPLSDVEHKRKGPKYPLSHLYVKVAFFPSSDTLLRPPCCPPCSSPTIFNRPQFISFAPHLTSLSLHSPLASHSTPVSSKDSKFRTPPKCVNFQKFGNLKLEFTCLDSEWIYFKVKFGWTWCKFGQWPLLYKMVGGIGRYNEKLRRKMAKSCFCIC